MFSYKDITWFWPTLWVCLTPIKIQKQCKKLLPSLASTIPSLPSYSQETGEITYCNSFGWMMFLLAGENSLEEYVRLNRSSNFLSFAFANAERTVISAIKNILSFATSLQISQEVRGRRGALIGEKRKKVGPGLDHYWESLLSCQITMIRHFVI